MKRSYFSRVRALREVLTTILLNLGRFPTAYFGTKNDINLFLLLFPKLLVLHFSLTKPGLSSCLDVHHILCVWAGLRQEDCEAAHLNVLDLVHLIYLSPIPILFRNVKSINLLAHHIPSPPHTKHQGSGKCNQVRSFICCSALSMPPPLPCVGRLSGVIAHLPCPSFTYCLP